MYTLIIQIICVIGVIFGTTIAIVEVKRKEERENSQIIVSICILISSLATFLRFTFFD